MRVKRAIKLLVLAKNGIFLKPKQFNRHPITESVFGGRMKSVSELRPTLDLHFCDTDFLRISWIFSEGYTGGHRKGLACMTPANEESFGTCVTSAI